VIIYIILALAIIGADQLVKAWVIANIPLNESQVFIPHVLSLTHIQNSGAAYSMLEGKQWFFYIVTVVALAVVAFLWKDSRKSQWYRFGLVLIFAGTIGNFIDRLRFQYVTDMFQLDFINFAIFNVADMALTFGVIFVLIYVLFFDGKGEHSRNTQ